MGLLQYFATDLFISIQVLLVDAYCIAEQIKIPN